MKKIPIAAVLVLGLVACSKTEAQKFDSSPTATAQPAAKAEPASAQPTSAAPTADPKKDVAVPPPASADPANPASPAAQPASPTASSGQAREWREITIPAGTILKVNLNTAVGSDTSKVEDPVRGTLRSPVVIGGTTALASGTAISGHVTDAARSAKVKGRARIALRFTRLDPPGPDDSMAIRTSTISRIAPGTKKQDAAKIGAGAVGGAIVGGIVGGGDGAAKGAVIGGGAGTGVVLATRGKEVRMGAGTPLAVRLAQAITVRVAVK